MRTCDRLNKKTCSVVCVLLTLLGGFVGYATTGEFPDKFVEYIQGKGAQYIELGAVLNDSSRVSIDFCVDKKVANFNVFGVQSSYAYITHDWLYVKGKRTITTCAIGSRYAVDIDVPAQTIIMNEQEKALSNFTGSEASRGELPTRIFWASGTNEDKAYMKLYSCSIAENGEPRLQLFPCVKDKRAGLYDTVSQTIFYDAGESGTDFDVGPEVPIPAACTVLMVDGEAGRYGSADPDYGVYDVAADELRVLAAPSAVTNDAKTVFAVCTGWKLYDGLGNLLDSGEGTTCFYRHSSPAAFRRLAWQWRRYYRVTVAVPGGGGSASCSHEWLAEDEAAALTATPDAGYRFVKFASRELAKDIVTTSATITVGNPTDVTAVFCLDQVSEREKTWVGASGESMPDGVVMEMPEVVEREYVKSTGEQIVDLQLVPGATTAVELHFNQLTYAEQGVLFGQTLSLKKYLVGMKKKQFVWNGDEIFNVQPSPDNDYMLTVGTDRKVVLKSNGKVVSTLYNRILSADATCPLAVFGGADSNNRTSFALKAMKVWQDGVLVRDLVPATKGETVCLFDKVEKKFYQSEGSAPLKAGPVKVHAVAGLHVLGLPMGYGPTDAYGLMPQAGGTVQTYTMPTEVKVDDTFTAICDGWELRKVAPSTGLVEKTEEGPGTSASVALPNPAELVCLVWKWRLQAMDAKGVAANYAIGDGVRWEDPSNWRPYGVPTASDRVVCARQEAVHVVGAGVCRSLQIAPSATLYLGGRDDLAKPQPYEEMGSVDRTLDVIEDLVIEGQVSMGAVSSVLEPRVTVGGDLVVSNAATLYVIAGSVEANPDAQTSRQFRKGGASFAVGGNFLVADSSVVRMWCHRTSGMPVVWNVSSNVWIGANANFDGSRYVSANKKSYGGGWVAPNGLGYKLDCGGSYGGCGGNGNEKTYGFANAPFYPGSPGTYREDDRGVGGGAVRLDAGGTVSLDGKIYALGSVNDAFGGNHAGSGGGVWITCFDFIPGETALINASGGDSTQHDSSRAGGGGRVAIMTGSPGELQLDQLYATGSCDNLVVAAEDLNDPLSPWPTLVSVAGGVVRDCSSNLTWKGHGTPGTAVYLKNGSGRCVVTVTGDHATTETTPAYGTYVVEPGSQTFAAPVFMTVVQGATRVPCIGYEWTDATGRSGCGTGISFTLDVTSDTTVSWKWGATEHFLDVRCGGYGALAYLAQDGNELGWYDEGSVVKVTCTPDDVDTVFDAWLGDVSAAQGAQPEISVAVDRPKRIVATLHRDATRARDVVWTGAAGDGDWFTPGNWDAGAVPGAHDRVTIVSGGDFQIQYPCAIRLASLTLGGSVRGFVGCHTTVVGYGSTAADKYCRTTYTTALPNADAQDWSLMVKGAMTIGDEAKLYLGGIDQTGRMDLSVGGDLTVTGTNSSTPAELHVCAGERGDWTVLDNYVSGGGSISVSGSLTLAGYASLTPAADRRSGATVPISAAQVTIDENAMINASCRGFGRSYENSGTGWIKHMHGYAVSTPKGVYGGTYGGHGGGNETESFGYETAPFYPGGAGNISSLLAPGYTNQVLSGGGAVRINARKVVLNGRILANAHGAYCIAGGAGGGVWITADRFIRGEEGSIEARHSDGTDYSGTCGGGGGRISICLKFSPDQITRLYATGEVRGMKTCPLSELPDWAGHFNVDGGTGVLAGGGAHGTAGTAVLVKAPPKGLALLVR